MQQKTKNKTEKAKIQANIVAVQDAHLDSLGANIWVKKYRWMLVNILGSVILILIFILL